MSKYILTALFFFTLSAGSCSVKQKQFVTTLTIEDSIVTNEQMDTAVLVVQKRLNAAKLEYTSVIANYKERQVLIQSALLDKDWIKISLLKKDALVFYECYSLVELAADLREADELVAHKIHRPGDTAMPVNPLFKVLNPVQPYDNGGRQSYSPFIGMVSKNDLPVFKKYLDMSKEVLPADAMLLMKEQESEQSKQKFDEIYFVKDNDSKFFASNHISSASVKVENKYPAVLMKFDAYGSHFFERMTTKNVDKPIAIVIDGNILSAPRVLGPIEGGEILISGVFTQQEAQDIANMLQSGYLPLQMKFKSIEELKKAE